jgi:hypothetical protein
MRDSKEDSIWWTLRLTFGLVPIIETGTTTRAT